jgi:hypothetical protein
MKTKMIYIAIMLALIVAFLPRYSVVKCPKPVCHNVNDYVTDGKFDWDACTIRPQPPVYGWKRPVIVALIRGDYWNELSEKDCR